MKRLIGMTIILSALCGCHTPDPDENGRVDIAKDDGFGSIDVLTVANKMGPSLLQSDVVSSATSPLVIAVAPIRGATPVGFDANLFLRRLRLELNQQANGKLLFVAQGQSQGLVRDAIRDDANSSHIQKLLQESADAIVKLPELNREVTFALLPSYNVNFVNLNPDSYLTMLCTRLMETSGRKISFLLPGKLEGADYYLSGQFIADSDKTEGMINLVDYIRDLEKAERDGTSVFEIHRVEDRKIERRSTAASDERTDTEGRFIRRSRLQHEAQMSPQLRKAPKVAKYLNLMIVDAKKKTTIYAKQLSLNDVTTGFGNANYILSAEVSTIRKTDSKYYLVTLQLVDPKKRIIVWESGCETKVQ